MPVWDSITGLGYLEDASVFPLNRPPGINTYRLLYFDWIVKHLKGRIGLTG